MKSTAALQLSFMPLPGERIGQWATRFQAHFSALPTEKHLSAPGMPWVAVSIAKAEDGTTQTRKLHNALGFLQEQYPDSDTNAPSYFWPGKLVFWFDDEDCAVLFKLALPNIN